MDTINGTVRTVIRHRIGLVHSVSVAFKVLISAKSVMNTTSMDVSVALTGGIMSA